MPAKVTDKAIPKRLVTALYDIRTEKCISQEKLAENAGLSREYVGRLERNNANISVTTFYKICNGLGVKPSEIFQRLGL